MMYGRLVNVEAITILTGMIKTFDEEIMMRALAG